MADEAFFVRDAKTGKNIGHPLLREYFFHIWDDLKVWQYMEQLRKITVICLEL